MTVNSMGNVCKKEASAKQPPPRPGRLTKTWLEDLDDRVRRSTWAFAELTVYLF